MEAFVSTPGCRRAVLSAFMDGAAGEMCEDVDGATLCDRCELLRRDDDYDEGEGRVEEVIEEESEGETEEKAEEETEGESQGEGETDGETEAGFGSIQRASTINQRASEMFQYLSINFITRQDISIQRDGINVDEVDVC
ncbi:hypothetical protein FPOAC2_14054 [Fusarium poae]